MVTRAAVITGGKLMVHQEVVGSKLRAGTNFPGAKKLSFLLRDIQVNLELLTGALEQLMREHGENLKRVDFGRIVMVLLDTKFKNLGSLVKNTIHKIAAAGGSDVLGEVASCAKSLNCLIGLNPLTVKSFGDLIRDVDSAAKLLQEPQDSPADVVVHSALTSNIQSLGKVVVTGQGCINTTINAAKDVVIKGSFKSGEIFCEGNVEVQELGSSLGMPPVVRVGAAGVIRVRRAFAGAVLQVGQRRLTLSQDVGSFKARLNKEGELDIIPGS